MDEEIGRLLRPSEGAAVPWPSLLSAGVWTGSRVPPTAPGAATGVSGAAAAAATDGPGVAPVTLVLAVSQRPVAADVAVVGVMLDSFDPTAPAAAAAGAGAGAGGGAGGGGAGSDGADGGNNAREAALLKGQFVPAVTGAGGRLQLVATEATLSSSTSSSSSSSSDSGTEHAQQHQQRVSHLSAVLAVDPVSGEETLRGEITHPDFPGSPLALFVLRRDPGRHEPGADPEAQHVAGQWSGSAAPDASLADFMIPTNPCSWTLALLPPPPRGSGKPEEEEEEERRGVVAGCGYFDDSGDVPGRPLLFYSLWGSWSPSTGEVQMVKRYESAAETAGYELTYTGKLRAAEEESSTGGDKGHQPGGGVVIHGKWDNPQGGSFGQFAVRLQGASNLAALTPGSPAVEARLAEVAQRLKAARPGSVTVLLGAGISTAASIPDFRSAGGMYDTLDPSKLTATAEQRAAMEREPTTVVQWSLFQENPLPYYEVRRSFILGGSKRWKPTLAHFAIRVLQDRGLLNLCLTQNIDGLEDAAEITELVHAHGSLGQCACEFCGEAHDMDAFRELVATHIKDIGSDPGDDAAAASAAAEAEYGPAPDESTLFNCPKCNKPGLKPTTVLYGRPLPATFASALEKLDDTGLLLVAGTSLTVAPCSTVPGLVPKDATRVILNREPVLAGEIDYSGRAESRDAYLPGDLDRSWGRLIAQAGWLPELAKYRDQMCEASQHTLDTLMRRD